MLTLRQDADGQRGAHEAMKRGDMPIREILKRTRHDGCGGRLELRPLGCWRQWRTDVTSVPEITRMSAHRILERGIREGARLRRNRSRTQRGAQAARRNQRHAERYAAGV